MELGVCVSLSDGPGRQWPGFWGARLQRGVSRAAGRERRRQWVLGPSGFVTQRVTCMWFWETVRVPRQPRGRAGPPRFLWGEAGASAVVITTAWTTGAEGPWSPSPQVRVAPPGPVCSSPVCGVFSASISGPYEGPCPPGGLGRAGQEGMGTRCPGDFRASGFSDAFQKSG